LFDRPKPTVGCSANARKEEEEFSRIEKVNKILILCDFPIRSLITSYYTKQTPVNPLN